MLHSKCFSHFDAAGGGGGLISLRELATHHRLELLTM